MATPYNEDERRLELAADQATQDRERMETALRVLELAKKVREAREAVAQPETEQGAKPTFTGIDPAVQHHIESGIGAGVERQKEAQSEQGFRAGLAAAREKADRRRPVRRGLSGLAGVLYTAGGSPQRSERAFARARQVSPEVQRYLEEQGALQKREAREQQMEARDLGMEQSRAQMQARQQQMEAQERKRQQYADPSSPVNQVARRILGIQDESVAPFADPKLLEMMQGNAEFRRKMAAEMAKFEREGERWKRQQDYKQEQKKEYFDYTAEEKRKRAALVGGGRISDAGAYMSEGGTIREGADLPDIGDEVRTAGDAIYQSILARAKEANLEGDEYEQVKRMAAPLAGARSLSRSDPEGTLRQSIDRYISQAEENRDIEQRAKIPGTRVIGEIPELTATQADKIRETIKARNVVIQAVRELQRIAKEAGFEEGMRNLTGIDNDAVAQAKAKQDEIMTQLRVIQNLGVPSDKEMQLVKSQVSDPTNFLSMLSAGPRLRALADRVDDSIDAGLRAYNMGLDVDQTGASAQESRRPQERERPSAPERVLVRNKDTGVVKAVDVDKIPESELRRMRRGEHEELEIVGQ